MIISMNELKAALRRCFEASGYFVGNYEDAANMVLWLEKHGLEGLKELELALDYIKSDRKKAMSKVVYEDSTSAIINCNGRSALNCIASAVDLAHAKALEVGISTITVHNCHNRKFILKALTDCGRRGISVAAYWQNGSTTLTEHTASIRAGARYPSYSESIMNSPADNASDKQSMTIICSSRVDISTSLQHSSLHRNSRYLSAEQVAANKENSVDYGIEIDDRLWVNINSIGAEILVENSEQSRQGAGA